MRPLQPGQNVRAIQCTQQKRKSMSCPETYNDYYGMGLRITGHSTLITFNKIYHIVPGSLIFINKNLYHRALYNEDQLVSGPRIHFNDKIAHNIISIIGKEQFDMLFDQVVINVEHPAMIKLKQLFDAIVEESDLSDKYSKLLLENMIIQLFLMILRSKDNHAAEQTISNTHNVIILNAIEYIEQHFASDPSLNDLAVYLNVSTSHLSRLFTSQIGTSYSDFLLRHKINHALKLLTNTNTSITEVAYFSGFSSINYFCSAFKKIIGISPLQYRKNNR